MNKQPFLYRDFDRVRRVVLAALQQADEPYVLVTGETGTGKTALLRDLKAELDRSRYRIFYFQEAQRLGARARMNTEPAALQLTRRADLLELELPEPDLSVYDRDPGADHENPL